MSHLKKKHGLVAAVVQAKVMGAPEQYCDASKYRRRGTPNKVGPTFCVEPIASTSTSMGTPMELSDTEDLSSLHPGEDESFILPDKTDVQAAPEFSDIGDSDAEELLDQLAEAYDEAFPEHSATYGSSSKAPSSSEHSFAPDETSTDAPNRSSEHHQGHNGAGTTTNGSTTGKTTTDGTTTNDATTGGDSTSLHTVLVQGINISLVRTTTKHPDGRVEDQRVASVVYTNSVNPADIACVQGSTNGTNGIPISFKVLQMVPMVIPLVPMVIPLVPVVMPMVPLTLPMVPLVPMVSQWYHWLPIVPLVK